MKVFTFFFFLFGTQVTLSCATKLSSKDQGWQQIKMTGINSWWLPRYKLVIVTFELSQLVFNHTLQSFEIIINMLSWSKVKSQDWIYQHVLKCWSKCKCSLSMHFIIIIVFLFFFYPIFALSHNFFPPPILPRVVCGALIIMVVFVSPFRPLTVQNVKMSWNLSHSGVEVSRQLDIPSTKIGEGAHYLFLYLSSSFSSPPCIRLSAVLLKHLIRLFHSLIQR